MSRLKNLLAVVALVGLSAVTVAAGMRVLWTEPPDWSGVDHAELREWLISDDVASAPQDAQQKLIWRLEQDFKNGGVDAWQADLKSATAAERQSMLDNLDLLARVWLKSKVDDWWAQPERERDRYVDRELDGLMAWRLPSAEQGLSSMQHPGDLLKRVQAWQSALGPKDQERATKFIAAVQRRWAQRQLQRMWPVSEGR